MTTEWPRVPVLALLVVATLSPLLFGQEPAPLSLGALIRPIKASDASMREQAQAIPQDKKNHVHFFLINGLDPLYAANLNGLASHFRSVGFANTSCHQFPSARKVRRQIESIRRTDPQARIVLLGFSVGANCVRGLANSMQREGISIDCLVYLGGDTVFNTASSKPGNVGKIINITGHGMIFLGRDIYFKGEDIDGAVNRRVDARHMNLPGKSDTIELIGAELIGLAQKVDAAAQRPMTADVPVESPQIVQQPR